MTTVASVLNGVRYDLRNYADIDFDSAQMIHYLNRVLTTLDYTLAAHNSDWTLNKGTVTLLEDNNSIAVPTGAFNIREVWVDEKRKENLDQMVLYYKNEFNDDATGEFNYWSHIADNIVVEINAYEDTTLTVYYDKFATAITAETDTMPYSGRFDNAIREAIVLMATAKKYKSPTEADAMYAQMFESLVHHDVINRKFVKRNYRLDF